MKAELKSLNGKTLINDDNPCPKCGKTETTVEIDSKTGNAFFVCSNKSCHTLRSKGWF